MMVIVSEYEVRAEPVKRVAESITPKPSGVTYLPDATFDPVLSRYYEAVPMAS